jgi:hypothetical protein
VTSDFHHCDLLILDLLADPSFGGASAPCVGEAEHHCLGLERNTQRVLGCDPGARARNFFCTVGNSARRNGYIEEEGRCASALREQHAF